MRRLLSVLIVIGSLALPLGSLHASSVSAATSVFATGLNGPESITPTAAGGFFVTDVDGTIWSVPPGGGSAAALASVAYSLRGGLILPAGFGALSGQFLVVGGDAVEGGSAFASTMDATFAVAPYASQAHSLWTEPVLAPSFGALSGDVLVTNQGDGGMGMGSVDFFTPSGTVGTLVTLSAVNVPFGAALAPSNFGDVGSNLLVSDAVGSGIYAVNPRGKVRLFATIPLGAGQRGLRQIAFAPKGWGRYSGKLFVSLDNDVIYVVNGDGAIIGTLAGAFSPRGLLFTTIGGEPSLLFSDISTGQILRAEPGDVVPVHGDGS